MKTLLLTLCVLCLSLFAAAKPVGKQGAFYAAQSYLLAKGKNITLAKKSFKARGRAIVQTEDEADCYYYVFNANGGNGYVIVSGDDRTEPILGYVEHGTFHPDSIPENMRSWLQLYADQIKYIVDNDVQPGSSSLPLTRNKAQAARHSIPEILLTRWGQGYPYNMTCPLCYNKDGSQGLPSAGCVATAMAQVVSYHKFPDKIKANIPAHSCSFTLEDGQKKTVSMKAIPKGTPIDWSNMLDAYTSTWEAGHVANAQDSAVANLTFYCGQAVKMGYGIGGSGAVPGLARDALVKYFGFDEQAYFANRADYSIDGWFNLLYDELDAGYPIFYSGFSSGGGHSFVVDGYDGQGLFHVNWGWYGSSNGYFLISVLNPGDNTGIGASSSSDGYSRGQSALLKLRVPTGARIEPRTRLTVSNVSVNGTFITGTWTNNTGSVGNFNTGIVRLDDDGTVSLVGRPQTITAMAVDNPQNRTFNLRGSLAEGIHRLSPASKLTTGKTWFACFDMNREYIEAVVDADGEITLQHVEPNYDVSIDTIIFSGTHCVNKQQEVKVTFRNNGSEYYRDIHLLASMTDDMIYTGSRSAVAIPSGGTAEISFFFTPEEVGTYTVSLCTGSNGTGEIGRGTIDIVSASKVPKANLSVVAMNVSTAVGDIVYGGRLIGKATIKNNARTDFHGRISFGRWYQKIGEGIMWSQSGSVVNVDIAAGKSAFVEFEHSDLEEGRYYYFPVNYVDQEGSLTGGDKLAHKYEAREGLITWKGNGALSGQAYRADLTVANAVCGLCANCSNFTQVTPNKNPNTIFALPDSMETPHGLESSNIVRMGRFGLNSGLADHVAFVSGYPFYAPISFKADTATFTYTFPETEKGTGWHVFTMPFQPDGIWLDSVSVVLDDSLKHFWIYELVAQEDDGSLSFAHATTLRGNAPYIIAADSTMAGRSITFRAANAHVSRTKDNHAIVASTDYQFIGTTLTPSVRGCYILSSDGKSFKYTSLSKTLTGLSAYIATTLPDENRLSSILLPDVPRVNVRQLTGDVNSDRAVDIADVVSILNIMAGGGFTAEADVNSDGTVDIADVVSVLNIMAQ